MHTNHGPRPDPLTDLGYEPKDVNMRKIGFATLFFFGFFAICVAATYFIIGWMAPNYYSQNADRPVLTNHIPAPPNPLLQTDVTTKTDIQDLRRAEHERLTTSAWVDPAKGIARIPIDRAMEIVVERGIGTKPTAAAPTGTTPTSSATGSATTTPAGTTGGNGE